MAKNHRIINGKLLQTNKRFQDLKQSQKEKISGWLYQEYRRIWLETGREPHKGRNSEILTVVMAKINDAEIWIPEYEVEQYFFSCKNRFRSRIRKETVSEDH